MVGYEKHSHSICLDRVTEIPGSSIHAKAGRGGVGNLSPVSVRSSMGTQGDHASCSRGNGLQAHGCIRESEEAMNDPILKDAWFIFLWILYLSSVAACLVNLHAYASKHDPFALVVAGAAGFLALAVLKGIPNAQ